MFYQLCTQRWGEKDSVPSVTFPIREQQNWDPFMKEGQPSRWDIPDDTLSHSVYAKQSRAGDRNGFAIKWNDKSGPKSSQPPSLGNMSEAKSSCPSPDGSPRQRQGLWVHSGLGPLLLHLLCSALHCHCTCSREWTGHSSRHSCQL